MIIQTRKKCVRCAAAGLSTFPFSMGVIAIVEARMADMVRYQNGVAVKNDVQGIVRRRAVVGGQIWSMKQPTCRPFMQIFILMLCLLAVIETNLAEI